ncbi:hypothetical protein SAMD00019534_047890 [Acytostelium subglobosum LB1]|uniref:hypothetical protein n=1 Tax=Acytostelium subglobosum LB1 TaxID=1410327 RepID=UPI000644E614|nr:hypothetical protein SAMD00019534_047890 [Acytostelium subglobosum LB1]GAM21614.1 hypothetical protein SAMD00019534_047890 [Acytostelium subglobosum LB1]|eukprot:XP_012755733.1 hypothetical protein SAMD00019534_047890 [Acytostelium subglobosum LB1]
MLNRAVGGGNLDIIKTLWQQTSPIKFVRSQDLLNQALYNGRMSVFKFLSESGAYIQPVLVRAIIAEAQAIYNGGAKSIAYILEPGNFSDDLINALKSQASKHELAIVKTGDWDLICMCLLQPDGEVYATTLSKGIGTLPCDLTILPMEQLSRLETLARMQLINPIPNIDQDAQRALIKSSDLAKSLHVGALDLQEEGEVVGDDGETITDELRMVYIKIGQYTCGIWKHTPDQSSHWISSKSSTSWFY